VIDDVLAEAVAAPTPERCVLALARAWAQSPSRSVARLCVGLSPPGQAVTGSTEADRERAWHTLAASADPHDLPALLATPWTNKPKDAVARLRAFDRFYPDPRIVWHLLDLDTGDRFSSMAGARFWRSAWDLMLRWGSTDAVRALPATAPTNVADPLVAKRWNTIFLPVLADWAHRLPREPATSFDLGKLEARLDHLERDRRALLEAVFERPAGDAPRHVLADALVDRGDPRGEFVSLQFVLEAQGLTLGRREHLERLLSAAGRQWFDGLLGQVTSLAVFRRGFLAEVRLASREPDPRVRAWRLIEAVDLAGLALPIGRFLMHEHTAGIRRVYDVRAQTFVHLAREVTRPLELVEVRAPLLAQRIELAAPIETLRIVADADEAMRWLQFTGLERQVRRLEFVCPDNARMARLFSAAGFDRLTVIRGPARWPQPLEGDWVATLVGDALDVHVRSPDGLAAVLSSLDPARVRRCSIAWAKRATRQDFTLPRGVTLTVDPTPRAAHTRSVIYDPR
jgi:uncharacterized protein (TIGR02996 family)